MKLEHLSSEVLLAIADRLGVFDLLNIRLLSRFWSNFFLTHESTLYHSACVLHGFAKPHQQLEEAIKEHQTETQKLRGVVSWKGFCQYNVLLDRYWRMGDSLHPPRPRIVERSSFTRNIPHRIKIDSSESLIMNTSDDGGLFVRCASTHKDLWCMYQEAVREFAHIEYSNGYAIFDRGENCHEVWVKHSMLPNLQVPCEPTLEQQQNAEGAVDFENDPENPFRGCMVPFGMLRNPIRTRAYRFVYPLLLVASEHDRRVVIWHVPTREIVEEFPIDGSEGLEGGAWNPDGPDRINYVELSATHVFISLSDRLVVLERGKIAPELNISQDGIATPSKPPKAGRKVFEFTRESLWNDTRLCSSRAHIPFKNPTSDISPHRWITDTNGTFPIARELADGVVFTAVHVSPDGGSFVAVSQEGLILYVENMLEVIDVLDKAALDSPIEWGDKMGLWILFSGKHISNLAYDGLKIVLNTPSELCVLHLKDALDYDKRFTPSENGLLTIVSFSRSDGATVCCIQMSESNIWYTYTGILRFPWPGGMSLP
ncbi:uncharacterized protein EI90DRAFT_1315206 [Cantharellus anzutake]|uniref:uncharacterized protein n=1 Tax=Cantharellus anzutake TaxID=1750568 RepID=UPI00190473CD|nr:uncharacterized protein EI90DRAFT_1315206 [Cantharellus anzutake]KAF8342210.1 hypothetical protein EI90DRAFT_1315206 [Cantharellus anzutake]